MRHLDLFSGIGGFSLAVDRAFHDQEIEHTFVEWEPFCQAVLKKHWPEAEIHGDIRAFIDDAKRNQQGGTHSRSMGKAEGISRFDRKKHSPAGWFSRADVYLLTGGFPCQPFSHAGRRKGTADDRWLWPPMLEAISIFRPRWVIAENVPGLISIGDGVVFDGVCSDLEKEGYEVQPFIIPAVAVGAPHRRERVWIIAHSDSRTDGGDTRENENSGRAKRLSQRNEVGKPSKPDTFRDAPNADSAAVRQQSRRSSGSGGESKAWTRSSGEDAADATSCRWREGDKERGRISAREGTVGTKERGGLAYCCGDEQWIEDWPAAATRLCTVDDGLRYNVVRPDGRTDAETRPRPKGWRNAALKAAGNAIVPQVAMQIMLAMKEVDDVL